MELQKADGRIAFAAPAAGALLLAACHTTPQPTPAPPAPNPAPIAQAPAAAAPVPVAPPPGSGFFFNDDPERASLAYGLADSDAVDLMLACAPGSRQVEITDAVSGKPRPGEAMVLASGDARASLPVKLEADEEHNQPVAVADAASDLAPLTVFRATGRIEIILAGRDLSLTATPTEQVRIVRFFSVCAAARPAPHGKRKH